MFFLAKQIWDFCPGFEVPSVPYYMKDPINWCSLHRRRFFTSPCKLHQSNKWHLRNILTSCLQQLNTANRGGGAVLWALERFWVPHAGTSLFWLLISCFFRVFSYKYLPKHNSVQLKLNSEASRHCSIVTDLWGFVSGAVAPSSCFLH